jgi:hypothetical protein
MTTSMPDEGKPNMTMFNGGARRLMTVGALAMAALSVGGTAAAAAPAGQLAQARGPATFVVDAGPLVLNHDGNHYAGNLPITVRNTGGEAAQSTALRIGVPSGLKFIGSDGICTFGVDEVFCDLFGVIEPGARQTFSVSFGAWAAPAARARITASAGLTVTPNSAGQPGAASDTYAGVLRGSTGSIRNPRPYAPATVARTEVTAGPASVTELPGTTGTREYEVRIPVTVHAGNDIPNDFGQVRTTAPEGSGFVRTDPSTVCGSTCDVPGDWLAAGNTRTFAIVFTYSTATLPVDETVTIEVFMSRSGSAQPEAAPARNIVSVPLTIAA